MSLLSQLQALGFTANEQAIAIRRSGSIESYRYGAIQALNDAINPIGELGSCLETSNKAFIDGILNSLSGASSTVIPTAAFSATPLTGNNPLSVQFADASTEVPTVWHWEKSSDAGAHWSDFTTPTVQNPVQVFAAGSWTVRLTATNLAGSSTPLVKAAYVIVAITMPVADFIMSLLSGAGPLAIDFVDESINAPTSWAWEKKLGTGAWGAFATTPTVQNPTETLTAGTWSIRLTATNAGGSSVKTRTGAIVVS